MNISLLSQDDVTIVAQCTPRGSGALAVIRLSGTNSIEIASKLIRLSNEKKLADQLTHTLHYGYVIANDGHKIDQVMLALMRGPKTFTGQDVVEITCHNNQFIVQAIIGRAIEFSARMAHEGEFAKRAVLNGKIDLLQAEAINDLIHANTQLSLKKSLAQLDGSFSHWLVQIEADLFKALAYSESSFEFIDEEMQFGDVIKEIVEKTIIQIADIKKSFDVQQHIRQGINVALVGAVNAGKSSLFNALLNKERAIVTDIAGTTRDAIEAGLYKNGNYWTLVDTAGLRQTEDIIEQYGIERTFATAHTADIILLVVDAARHMTQEEYNVYEKLVKSYEKKIILIEHKIDLPCVTHSLPFNGPIVAASSTSKINILELEKVIQEKINALFAAIESPFLLNQRQFNLMLELEKKLTEVLPMLKEKIAYELVSCHLKDALAAISELTGKSVCEVGMDKVFREFCVGK